MQAEAGVIELVEIDQIQITNPRERRRASLLELVESIRSVGLKRPITVALARSTSAPRYNLVCGQGRIEAFRALGRSKIPAHVVEASVEEALLKGLVENCARRQHTASELLHDIGRLRGAGVSDSEISRRTGLSLDYVQGVADLIDKGEKRLLRAVESGHIPISAALIIARAEDAEVQSALQDAYEHKELRGRKLVAAQRLVESRRRLGRGLRASERQARPVEVSAASVVRVYEQDARKKRLLVEKANAARNSLIFITHALRQLLQEQEFRALLEEEGLVRIPLALERRMRRGAAEDERSA